MRRWDLMAVVCLAGACRGGTATLPGQDASVAGAPDGAAAAMDAPAVMGMACGARLGASQWRDAVVSADGARIAVQHFDGQIDLLGPDGSFLHTVVRGPRSASLVWLSSNGDLL